MYWMNSSLLQLPVNHFSLPSLLFHPILHLSAPSGASHSLAAVVPVGAGVALLRMIKQLLEEGGRSHLRQNKHKRVRHMTLNVLIKLVFNHSYHIILNVLINKLVSFNHYKLVSFYFLFYLQYLKEI